MITVRRSSSAAFGLLVGVFVAVGAAAISVGALLSSAQAAAPTSAMLISSNAEIDRIDVTGVVVFGRTEIESALELNVGEHFDRAKVVKTAENLVALYKSRGFEQMQVRGDFVREKSEKGVLETVLRFNVQEGKPTRIASASVASIGPVLDSSISKVDLQPGDVFDQDKVNSAKRGLQELLASEEFVGAKIEDVRVIETQAPADLKPLPDAARWVKLEIRVDPGDRASFGFRGNDFFTRSELLAFVTDQRVLGLGKDYVGAIQKRIEDEYKAKGFAHIHVKTFLFEKPKRQERHITYEINEGPRVEIESVDFDGHAAFSNSTLKDEFFQVASPLTQRRYYVEKEVQASADLLIEWIQSQGYLTAKLVAVNRSFSQGGEKVRLVIYLYEGDQTIIQSISLPGLKSMSENEAVEILHVQLGKSLNLFAFNEGLEALKRAYRLKGFLEMHIANEDSDKVVQYSQDNRSADILVQIAEGLQYRVSGIEIAGLENTREEVVRRELTFKVGDVVAESMIQENESRLRRLGIFAEASIRLIDDSKSFGGKIVRISLQEGSPGVLAGGAGYRQDLGVRAFGQTGYNNLMGKNHELNFNLNTNYRELGGVFCSDTGRGNCFLEYQAQLSYIWPWFMGDRTTFRPQTRIERTRYVNFDVISASAAAIFERRLIRSPNLTAGLTYNLERTKQYDAVNTADNRSLTIGAVIPSLRIDLRDNSLAPTRGFFAFSSLEIADPLFGSQKDTEVAYYRFQLRMDGFIPVSRDISLYTSFRTGYARNNVHPPSGILSGAQANQYALPLVKQFALGGVTSLRGYQEQQFNFQDQAILGTIAYVNYRTQLDLPFAGALRFGPFLDAGNLLLDTYSLTHNINYGTGFGFHYQSPVGPVNFDVGFALGAVAPGQNRQRFYFSIGVL